MLEPFRYDFVTCLWLISFKNTGVIRIWFWHIFTICFPQKCWNHLDMVMLHICHLFASKILESFRYVSVTYLSLICFEILASFEYGSVVLVTISGFYWKIFSPMTMWYHGKWNVSKVRTRSFWLVLENEKKFTERW